MGRVRRREEGYNQISRSLSHTQWCFINWVGIDENNHFSGHARPSCISILRPCCLFLCLFDHKRRFRSVLQVSAVHWPNQQLILAESDLFICLSIFVYLFVRLSVCLFIYLSVIYLSVYLFAYLSTFLSIYLSFYLFACLSFCLPIYLPVYLLVCLSIFLYIYLSVYKFAGL